MNFNLIILNSFFIQIEDMDPKILERIVALRHELHRFPETSFKEFETQKRLKNILIQLGVESEWIRETNPTGIIVDIRGKAASSGKDYCVAFRADMDALSMTEENDHLEYKSQNKGAAHMCGHDGHMSCLMGFVPLFLASLHTIPSNKKVRLLFQPSEEGPASGAELMIAQGCLEGVDEVYGFHNWPTGKFGELWCKEGPVMSQVTVINIKITGTGGHGSEPEKLKVAVWKAVEFYQKIMKFLDELKEKSGKFFVCTLPVFQSGERFNVISETVTISGTLRSFDKQILEAVTGKFRELVDEIKNDGFGVDLHIETHAMTSNTKNEAQHVLRVAREHLGEDKVSSGTLPFRASEDFGYYTMVKPGAFFFFCTKRQENEVFLHNSHFNFKDDLIEIAATFWQKLALDRLLSE